MAAGGCRWLWRVPVVLAGLAHAAGPARVATGHRQLWPSPVNTVAEFDQASRAALSAEPVAYLVERHAFRVSPDGQDADGSSWLVECLPTEPGAFPVYAAPQPRAFQTADGAQERKPLTEQEIWDAVQHGVIGGIGFPTKALAVARAIEAAHGIGAQPKGDA